MRLGGSAEGAPSWCWPSVILWKVTLSTATGARLSAPKRRTEAVSNAVLLQGRAVHGGGTASVLLQLPRRHVLLLPGCYLSASGPPGGGHNLCLFSGRQELEQLQVVLGKSKELFCQGGRSIYCRLMARTYRLGGMLYAAPLICGRSPLPDSARRLAEKEQRQ